MFLLAGITFINSNKARKLTHDMTFIDFTVSKTDDVPKLLLQFGFLK